MLKRNSDLIFLSRKHVITTSAECLINFTLVSSELVLKASQLHILTSLGQKNVSYIKSGGEVNGYKCEGSALDITT